MLRFEFEEAQDLHTRAYDGTKMVGHLQSQGTEYNEYFGAPLRESKVLWVAVDLEHRRQGIATEMWKRHQEHFDVDLKHHRIVTPSGREWAKSVGASTVDIRSGMRVEAHPHRPKVKRGERKSLSVKPLSPSGPTTYVEALHLNPVDLVVQSGGLNRAQEEGVRNVHAYARGIVVAVDNVPSPSGWSKLRYNPFEADTFIDQDSREPVLGASEVLIIGGDAYYKGGTRTAMPRDNEFLSRVQFVYNLSSYDDMAHMTALLDGKSIGKLEVAPEYDQWIIQWVYVKEEYQRKGLATEMLWRLEDRLGVDVTHDQSSLSQYGVEWARAEEPSGAWEQTFTMSAHTGAWADVREKGKRIRAAGDVRILVAPDGSNRTSVAEVRGSTGMYENEITFQAGSRKRAAWRCGCPWGGGYTWGRSEPYHHLAGRPCAHTLAHLYEIQSREWGGNRDMAGEDFPFDDAAQDWEEFQGTTPSPVGWVEPGQKYAKATEALVESNGAMVCLIPPDRLATELSRKTPSGSVDKVTDHHITLAYLGSASNVNQDDVRAAAAIVASRHQPLSGTIQGYGIFEHPDGNKVLYASPSIFGLSRLREDLVSALREVGVSPSTNYDFVPHITLGYYAERPELPDNVPGGAFPLGELWLVFGGKKEALPLGAGFGRAASWHKAFVDPQQFRKPGPFGRDILVEYLADDGGYSWDDYRPTPKSGYMVATFPQSEEKYPAFAVKSDPSIIRGYLERHEREISRPDVYAGAWEDAGMVYLDLSTHVNSLDEALELGRRHNQLAVFDLSTFESIDVKPRTASKHEAMPMGRNMVPPSQDRPLAEQTYQIEHEVRQRLGEERVSDLPAIEAEATALLGEPVRAVRGDAATLHGVWKHLPGVGFRPTLVVPWGSVSRQIIAHEVAHLKRDRNGMHGHDEQWRRAFVDTLRQVSPRHADALREAYHEAGLTAARHEGALRFPAKVRGALREILDLDPFTGEVVLDDGSRARTTDVEHPNYHPTRGLNHTASSHIPTNREATTVQEKVYPRPTASQRSLQDRREAVRRVLAARAFSSVEKRQMIDEGSGVRARNLQMLDVAGTHYLPLEPSDLDDFEVEGE